MITALLILGVLVLFALVASRTLGRATFEVEAGDETKHAELGGVWVRYRVSGSGPPVLLVHGLLSSGRVWERLARELSAEFTVYSLDLAGFGESDKPLSGYGIRQGSRLLHAFCARFGISDAAVVGHDVGGDMAVKLAADHPDAVSSLTLVATPATEGQLDLPTPVWLATLPVVGPLFFGLLRASRLWRRVGLRPFVFEREDLPEDFVEDAGRTTASALARTVSAARRELSRERLLRQADRVRCPVLLISGEEDQIVSPDSAENWADILSRSERLFLEARGHLPMIEHPEDFEECMWDFLTGDFEGREEDELMESPEAGLDRPEQRDSEDVPRHEREE